MSILAAFWLELLKNITFSLKIQNNLHKNFKSPVSNVLLKRCSTIPPSREIQSRERGPLSKLQIAVFCRRSNVMSSSYLTEEESGMVIMSLSVNVHMCEWVGK